MRNSALKVFKFEVSVLSFWRNYSWGYLAHCLKVHETRGTDMG